MQGVVLLLVLCISGVLVAGLAVAARWSRLSDERAGYYGRTVQRRHQEAEADASAVAAIIARSDRDTLSGIVETLDRLAWRGVPLVTAHLLGAGVWSLLFRDGTRVDVRAHDGRALRRAAVLARRDALVVSHVHPSEDAVVVLLRTPHHAPLKVALTA